MKVMNKHELEKQPNGTVFYNIRPVIREMRVLSPCTFCDGTSCDGCDGEAFADEDTFLVLTQEESWEILNSIESFASEIEVDS